MTSYWKTVYACAVDWHWQPALSSSNQSCEIYLQDLFSHIFDDNSCNWTGNCNCVSSTQALVRPLTDISTRKANVLFLWITCEYWTDKKSVWSYLSQSPKGFALYRVFLYIVVGSHLFFLQKDFATFLMHFTGFCLVHILFFTCSLGLRSLLRTGIWFYLYLIKYLLVLCSQIDIAIFCMKNKLSYLFYLRKISWISFIPFWCRPLFSN